MKNQSFDRRVIFKDYIRIEMSAVVRYVTLLAHGFQKSQKVSDG